jgi:hypothetical protein
MSYFVRLHLPSDEDESDFRLIKESAPWAEERQRPGCFRREFEFQGMQFSEEKYVCHICASPFGMNYFVLDKVWAQAGLDRGFVCLTCLERRLGRPLVRADFKDVPANIEVLHLTKGIA